MKTVYKLFLSTLIIFITSCDSYMDVHKEYIKDGEIIYAPKLDSIIAYAGNNRIKLRMWLYNAPNVKTVDIFWNDGLDSIKLDVTPSTHMDTIEYVLNNMEEKSYTFNVTTTDLYGHKSLATAGFGTAYGDLYRAQLNQRRIRDVVIINDTAYIDWFTAQESMVCTSVSYTMSNGVDTTILTNANESQTVCPLAISGSTFQYYSIYQPEEESFDLFSTMQSDTILFIKEYDRSNWEVIDYSDQQLDDGGGITSILDGNLNTFWHSSYNPLSPLPHWIVIDMHNTNEISKIKLVRRMGNSDAQTANLYISDNALEWNSIGQINFESGDTSLLVMHQAIKGRYLKVEIIKSNHKDGCSSIAEVYALGI